MSSARRPLLTATAAGTLLCALWFVPSAHASQDDPARAVVTEVASTQVTQQAKAVSTVTAEAAGTATDGAELADTGSFDTTPYVVGGTAFLALGAGFVAYSVRRERLGF
ncbi:LPXTG cell wall anchor domain-containing protein [Streptomyces sp. NPDC002676]